jgi:hypothetical protein
MQKPPVVQITAQQLDELIGKLASPVAAALTPEEAQLVVAIITGYAQIYERTESGDMSIKILRGLLGIKAPKPEGSGTGGGPSGGDGGGAAPGTQSGGNDQPPGQGDDDHGEDVKPGSETDLSDNCGEPQEVYGPWPRNRHDHGRRGPDDFPNAPLIKCPHDLKPGDPCPDCQRGRLLRYAPKFFVSIDSQPPFKAIKVWVERLWCGFCKKIFTAEIPADLEERGCDGARLYSHEATALIAINKYFGGQPWYRAQALGGMMDFHLPDSSQWDQSEFLANVLRPVVLELWRLAALVWLAYVDDTSGDIIDLPSKTVTQRKTGKETERTGGHTSIFVGILDSGTTITLYKTGIQHVGEMMDVIFRGRPAGLPIPQIMADAATCNTVTVTKVYVNLCLVHLFRKFRDCKEQYPKEAAQAMHLLGIIFAHDRHTLASGMPREQRLAYHREHSRPAFKDLCRIADSADKNKLFNTNEDIMAAYGYLLNNEPGLAGFYKRLGAPVENNRAERAAKTIIPCRNNSYHFRNVVGAGVADVIWSAGATAADNGANMHHYFASAARFKDLVRREPNRFMPWNYRETIDVEVSRRSSRPINGPPQPQGQEPIQTCALVPPT